LVYVPIKGDSALMRAYIDCVNGKPVIKTIIKYVPGKKTSAQISMNGNIATIDCKVDSSSVVTHYMKTHIRDFTSKMKTISYPVNILKWWQNIVISCGFIFLGEVFLGLIFLLIKLATKFKIL
jgi:hypothetical protein